MKIALMTWYSYKNYGTYLQATAMIKILEALGHEVDLVQYDPNSYEHRRYDVQCRFKSVADIKKRVKRKINYWKGNYNQVELFAGIEFEQYAAEVFKFSNKCTVENDFRSISNEYDVFICGSDQIWSPLCFDPHYYLNFVDSSKKISYAPSMGVYDIKNKEIERQIKNLIDDFRYLSIREESGRQIIKNLAGRDAMVAVDPTLLLNQEEWDKQLIISDNTHEDYVLVYFLGDNPKSWKQTEEIARKMNLPCKIIPVYPKDKKRNGCIEKSVGPTDFVDLIRNAKYVCTDSFHGVAFSITYGKNFCCFKRFQSNDVESQNSRIFSILQKLNLEERLYDGHDMKHLMQNIDYKPVHKKLYQWKHESKEFLVNSLDCIERKER